MKGKSRGLSSRRFRGAASERAFKDSSRRILIGGYGERDEITRLVIKWRNGRLKRLLAEVAAGSRSSHAWSACAREKNTKHDASYPSFSPDIAGPVYPRGGDAFFRLALCDRAYNAPRPKSAAIILRPIPRAGWGRRRGRVTAPFLICRAR